MKKGKALFLILLLAACQTCCPRPVSELNAELLEAVEQGNAKAVKSLLKTKADVETVNKIGQTLLGVAAYKGNAEIVKLLLDAGADVNVVDKLGNTALLYIAGSPEFDLAVVSQIVELLIDAGRM